MDLLSPVRPHFFAARALAWLSLLLLSLGCASTALAQQTPPAPDEITEVIKQLRKQIAEVEARSKESEARTQELAARNKEFEARTKELEARTKELEAQLLKNTAPSSTQTAAATQPAATEAAAQATQAEAEAAKEEHEASPAVDHMGHGSGVTGAPGLQIRGYGDVSFRASSIKGQTSTFALGQLNLFVTSRLSEKMSVLSEIGIELQQDNGVGVDLERILLQYAVSQYFNLNVGRYHTAIGYYNTAFHHGSWYQTAIGRPFLFMFEDAGGVLPIHNVGVSVNGRLPAGKLGLSYIAEVGNGRTSRSKQLKPVQNTVDENNGKAINLGLHARPRWVPGLQMGFSVYRDRLTPTGLPKIGQTIWAAHVVYQTPSFEFLNEAALIRHTPWGSQQTFNTPGFYTQISQRFFNKVRPYFRYEYLNVPARDPINSEVGRRNGPIWGVRYELGEFAALKLQYGLNARRGQSTSSAVRMQFAFTF